MLSAPRMPPVGLDPFAARRLRGLLDASAEALRACAARVQVLLDEAGVACTVPAEIRSAAGWCGTASAELRGRIALIDRPLARISARPLLFGHSGVQAMTVPTPVASPPWNGLGMCGVMSLPGIVMSCHPPQRGPEVLIQPPSDSRPSLLSSRIIGSGRGIGATELPLGAAPHGAVTPGRHEGVIDTPAGPVDIEVQIEIEGDTVVARDLLVYPADSEAALAAGVGPFKAAVDALSQEAAAEGYRTLRLEFYRTGGANPFTHRTLTRDLTRFRA